jgi:RNA polymerase sigma-70 factor, ECF subfamily
LDIEVTRIFKAKKDIREFDYLYRKYFPKINNFVFHRVCDEDVKNEIVSNVFFKAMKKLNMFRIFDVNKVTFSAWLYRIAVNEINQYFRNSKRHINLKNSYKHNYVEPVKDEKQPINYEIVKNYMQNLSDTDQNLISLRYFEKQSYQELSEIFKKSEGALKVKLHRALNKLRDSMSKEFENEEAREYIR